MPERYQLKGHPRTLNQQVYDNQTGDWLLPSKASARLNELEALTEAAQALTVSESKPMHLSESALKLANEVASFLETGEAFGVDLDDADKYTVVNRIAYEIQAAEQRGADRQKERLDTLREVAYAADAFERKVAEWCAAAPEKISFNAAMAFGLEVNVLQHALERADLRQNSPASVV